MKAGSAHHSPGSPADEVASSCVAFLASRMDPERPDLNRLRRQIYALGQELRQPIWVAEFSSPELSGQPPEDVQIRCLRHVRAIPEFICIVDGSYGTPWNLAQLCVLELEIFTAALAGKPFHFFVLDPYDTDPRTASLLRAIRLAKPELGDMRASSADAILGELRSRFAHRPSARLSKSRAGDSSCAGPPAIEDADLDVRFLDGDFSPLIEGRPNENVVSDLLSKARSESDEATRLVSTWMAIRHLCAAPYSDPTWVEFLPLWDTALSQWASAAAWYGLHGHHYLGRLAAVNSLLWIRQQMSRESNVEGLSIQGTYGARASEYYSMAKLAGTRATKRRLLRLALTDVNCALDVKGMDTSGLLAIRGSVLQALGQLVAGVRDYENVLGIRLAKNEDAGRIGEAQVELGMGYLRTGRIVKGGRLLREGVSNLEQSDRYGFIVRALRKLALFYVVTLRHRRAAATLEHARHLAEAHQVKGQLQQIEAMSRMLALLTWRGLIAFIGRWSPILIARRIRFGPG